MCNVQGIGRLKVLTGDRSDDSWFTTLEVIAMNITQPYRKPRIRTSTQAFFLKS